MYYGQLLIFCGLKNKNNFKFIEIIINNFLIIGFFSIKINIKIF